MPNSTRKTRRLTIAYALTLIALALITAQGIKKYNGITQTIMATDSSFQLISQVTLLDRGVKELGQKERGFLLFQDTSLITDANKVIHNIKSSITMLEEICSSHTVENNLIRFLNADIQQRIYYFRQSVKANEQRKAEDTINKYFLLQGKVLEEKINLLVDSLSKISYKGLQVSKNQRIGYGHEATNYLAGMLGLVGLLVMTLFIALLIEFNIRTRQQEKLARNLFQLRLAKKELDQIAFGATHTLQEPIRKIRLFMTRAADLDITNVVRQQYLNRADENAIVLQNIITDMGRLAEMNIIGSFKKINLNICLNTAIENLKTRNNFNKDYVQAATLPGARGNKEQLILFFEEVLLNCQQAAQPDVPLQIFISPSIVKGSEIPLSTVPAHLQKELFYKISINDNGEGFEMKYAQGIFNAFNRLKTSGTNHSGIGLALCQRIATNHGGYVTASSAPGNGTNISLFLPQRRLPELY